MAAGPTAAEANRSVRWRMAAARITGSEDSGGDGTADMLGTGRRRRRPVVVRLQVKQRSKVSRAVVMVPIRLELGRSIGAGGDQGLGKGLGRDDSWVRR